MKALSVAEIRERYLRFFEARGHARLPSDSLVPANDPTLLFTGAGMNQFKDMFLGKGALPHRRVTTSQKCLRVPDLDNVGVTPRHHTFFEMLGNFSFGDYFKKECIAWEWEWFSKELGIPEDQMVVTIYQDDDEAYEIWREDVGLPDERIYRFGEKENFWPAEAPSKGPNGPCGPCSEIYFDAFPDRPLPANKGLHELPEDRFTEIGNCVFTQFDRQEGGTLAPLPQKNIDVGLGLERIAAVLAGAPNNFETDIFEPFLQFVAERSGRRYQADSGDDARMRRIADHVRALVFCIADGALPGNEGRGYVVRKILRRAARDGMELGIEGSFLHEMVDLVGAAMGGVYPEVVEHAAQCRSIIKGEEEGFATVYRHGVQRLETFLAGVTSSGGGVLAGSGEFAFELHDTHGFPVDITRQIMRERGLALDEGGFEAAMTAQRERARAAMATSSEVFADNAAMVLRQAGLTVTEFAGYDGLAVDTEILAMLDGANAAVEEAVEGDEVLLVVARTPFYAQGGGQVGDRGSISGDGGSARIEATSALDGFYLHRAVVGTGALRVGMPCRLEVDEEARRATERNHTATHLLHAALKKVLGDHVSQAGSEVAPERLRFDFTHGEKLSPEQIEEIERLVSREVMAARAVDAVVRPLDEARAAGFVALFGEKYANDVRTIAVGEFSKELCGGTHVANSGNIGPFRITAETAVSAGTRRIEAVTGHSALALQVDERRAVGTASRLLKVKVDALPDRVGQLLDESKKLRKQLDKALAPDPAALLRDLEKEAVEVDGVRCVVVERQGLNMKQAQELLGAARKKLAPFVGVLFVKDGAQALVVAAATPDVAGRVGANDLVAAAAAVMGGGGGGRPEMAQGKGKDAGKIGAARDAVLGRLRDAGIDPAAG